MSSLRKQESTHQLTVRLLACHSERSEESLFLYALRYTLFFPDYTDILAEVKGKILRLLVGEAISRLTAQNLFLTLIYDSGDFENADSTHLT